MNESKGAPDWFWGAYLLLAAGFVAYWIYDQEKRSRKHPLDMLGAGANRELRERVEREELKLQLRKIEEGEMP